MNGTGWTPAVHPQAARLSSRAAFVRHKSLLSGATLANIGSVHYAPSAGQRHPQPIGPMRELVFDFIERLLQQEKIEKTVGSLGRLRPKSPVAQRRPIRRHEGGDGVFAPIFERADEPAVFIGCRLERTLERSRCGIVDRADEAGHVAGGGSLAPAILDAASRFTFEIDDSDVVLDDQHLPEMKITVMTDLHRVDGFRKQFAQSRGKRVSIGQERVDQLAVILRPLRSATCQVPERTASTL